MQYLNFYQGTSVPVQCPNFSSLNVLCSYSVPISLSSMFYCSSILIVSFSVLLLLYVFPSFNYPVVFSVSSTFFFHLSILNIFSFSVPMSMSMFISYYHVFILPQLPSVSYSHTTFHCYPFNVPLFRPSRSSLTSKRRAQSTKMTGDGHQIT